VINAHLAAELRVEGETMPVFVWTIDHRAGPVLVHTGMIDSRPEIDGMSPTPHPVAARSTTRSPPGDRPPTLSFIATPETAGDVRRPRRDQTAFARNQSVGLETIAQTMDSKMSTLME
jgi:hypothetical protein